jgi:hypothetical protein
MLRSKGATRAACAFFGEAVQEGKDLYVLEIFDRFWAGRGQGG